MRDRQVVRQVKEGMRGRQDRQAGQAGMTDRQGMSCRLEMHERKVKRGEGRASRAGLRDREDSYLRGGQDGQATGRTSIRGRRVILARQAKDSLNLETGQVRGSQRDVAYLG
jgi:hypothetical protein